jgi:hypothetical protein
MGALEQGHPPPRFQTAVMTFPRAGQVSHHRCLQEQRFMVIPRRLSKSAADLVTILPPLRYPANWPDSAIDRRQNGADLRLRFVTPLLNDSARSKHLAAEVTSAC